MDFLADELVRAIPDYSDPAFTPDNPLVTVRFHLTDGHWAWYPLAIWGKRTGPDLLFWGYTRCDVPDIGLFRLSELRRIRGVLGRPVVRDLRFQPCRLNDLIVAAAADVLRTWT